MLRHGITFGATDGGGVMSCAVAGFLGMVGWNAVVLKSLLKLDRLELTPCSTSACILAQNLKNFVTTLH